MITQNPHKVKSLEEKEKVQEERIQQVLAVKYRKLPYSVRWAPLVPIFNIFSWVFTGYSFLIGVAAISAGIYLHWKSTVSIIVACVLAPVIAGGIEWLKRICNYNFWSSGISEDDWSKENAAGMVVTTVASIGLAYWGGINLPELTSTPPTAIIASLENVEAIRADYDSQIEKQEQAIAQFDDAAPRWKGVMNKENTKQLGEMNDALTALMTAKNTAVQDAEHRNRQKQVDVEDANKAENALYSAYKEDTGWLFAIIAIAVELLMIIPFWQKERYYYNCYLERGGGSGTITPLHIQTIAQQPIQQQNINSIITTNPNQAPPSTAAPTTPLTRVVVSGFASGIGVQDKEEKEEVQNASNPLYKAYKTNEQQEKEPDVELKENPAEQQETVILKNTYTHCKDGGGQTEMTLPQIQARVRQYQKSVDEAIAKIEDHAKAGDDINVKFWKGLYPGRVKNLTYWQQAEQQLKQQLQKIKETLGE